MSSQENGKLKRKTAICDRPSQCLTHAKMVIFNWLFQKRFDFHLCDTLRQTSFLVPRVFRLPTPKVQGTTATEYIHLDGIPSQKEF